ncbi:MAG: hypothetical protein PHE09_17260 [Oscillospiraceae bacterium]|nr:hypothetical protein [Oscillospiraceae bacterium]
MSADLSCGVPLDDEHNACNGGVGHSRGQGRDDGCIVDGNGVAAQVAHAGHVAAGDGSGDEILCIDVRSVRTSLSAAADGDCEAQLVRIYLFTGKRGLVAKCGQLPAGRGGDGDGLHTNCAIGIVDDLAVVGGGHIAILRHGHGQRSGDGHTHGGGGGVAAGGAVIGGAEIDRRRAGTARRVDFSGKGGDRQGADHTKSEDHG